MKFWSVFSSILFIVAWVLMLLSLFNTWYYVEYKNPELVSFNSTSKYEFRIGKVITTYQNGAKTNVDTKDFIKLFGIKDLKFKEFLSASAGFAIIAWIVCIVQIVLCLLDIIGKSSRIGRFLGILVCIFTMLSLSIITGFKKPLHSSCIKVRDDCNESPLFGLFDPSWTGENDYSEWGYGRSWVYFICAFVLSFVGAVYNIFFFNRITDND